MPYEITASRKRPQSFRELAGQEFVSATLESSLASGRIAHAYLFSGPRGCGKTSAARILAKSLNCEAAQGTRPCGTCRSCVEIARGASLDVIEIDGASNTSVENVRQIKDEVLFPPNGGRYKVYIIDEVHMLSNSAFNALLKTIEEPPPYIVFIFATTELHKVPATIKSRCQQFGFRLIHLDIVKALLAEAAAELQVQADEDALIWIAKESGGSLRDAYTLFDQVVSFSDGKLSAALIRDKLGLAGLDALNELFALCAAGDTAGALDALDGILARGVSVEQCVVDSVEYWRSLLLLKQGIAKPSLLGAPASSFDAPTLAALTAERIERALGVLLDLYRNLRITVDPRFELELALARLSRLADYVAPSELARVVGGMRRWLAGEARGGSAAQAPGAVAAAVRPGAREGLEASTPAESAAEKKKHELPASLRSAFGSLAAAAREAEGTEIGVESEEAPPVTQAPRRAAPGSVSPPAAVAASAAPVPVPPAGGRSPAFAPRPSSRPAVLRDDDAEGEEDSDEGPAWTPAGPDMAAPGTSGAQAEPGTPVSANAPLSGARPPDAFPQGGEAEGLRAALIEQLGRSSPLLKTGLAASLPWRLEEGRLVVPFRSGMEESVVKASVGDIAARAAVLAGRPLKVELRVEGTAPNPAVTPAHAGGEAGQHGAVDPVAVVERVFRGSVVQPRQQQGARDEHR